MKALEKNNSAEFKTKQNSVFFQPKLTINNPNDNYEQEADAMADKVMRMRINKSENNFFKPADITSVQRKCAHCDEEEKLQRKESGNAEAVASDELQNYTGSMNSGGNYLSKGTRSFFEPRFGYDFSNVKIHNDSVAAKSAQSINALAYTSGNNIVFNQNQYSPDTDSGKKLLAHELTHVVQQKNEGNKNTTIRRKTPVFKDCNEDTAFIPGANKELEVALKRARDFLDVAISVLRWDYTKFKSTSVYRTAVTRHFINPDAAERETIRSNSIKMRDKLTPGNLRCVSSDSDVDICYNQVKDGIMAAFFRDNNIFLCPNFWMQSTNCKAIILIHEAAHAMGLGLGTHPPYRGAAVYPFDSGTPVPDQSAKIRINNPESYSYFAAHIWREIDSQCRALSEVLIIKSKAPDTPSK